MKRKIQKYIKQKAEEQKMSFRVGQKVRVREDLELSVTYGNVRFHECMSDICGEVATVCRVDDLGGGAVYLLDIGDYYYSAEMLEPVEDVEEVVEDTNTCTDVHTNLSEQWDDIIRFLYERNYDNCQYNFDNGYEYGEWLKTNRPVPSILRGHELDLLKSLSDPSRKLSYYAIVRILHRDCNWFDGVDDFDLTVEEVLNNYRLY